MFYSAAGNFTQHSDLEEERHKFNKTVMNKDLLFGTNSKHRPKNKKLSMVISQRVGVADKKLAMRKFKEKQEENYTESQNKRISKHGKVGADSGEGDSGKAEPGAHNK